MDVPWWFQRELDESKTVFAYWARYEDEKGRTWESFITSPIRIMLVLAVSPISSETHRGLLNVLLTLDHPVGVDAFGAYEPTAEVGRIN